MTTERIEVLLRPCQRDGAAGDWWGPQHKHCTGAHSISPGQQVWCSCPCHRSPVAVAAVPVGDAYQRGNRDGLLNLAAELDAIAEGSADRAKRIRNAPGYRLTHGPLADGGDWAASAYRAAAALARRRAEAWPEDPETGEGWEP